MFNIKTIIELFDKPIFDKNLFLINKYLKRPKLVCVLTSDDAGSISYVKGIKNICEFYGIIYEEIFSNSAAELEKIIKYHNEDKETNGIIVMYPTPYDVNDTHFMNLVSIDKDVEGLNNYYLGYLIQHEMYSDEYKLRKNVIPPTAKGILYLLKRYYRIFENNKKNFGKYPDNVEKNPFSIEGKSATIINDSLSVGRSLSLMLLNEHASIRVCQKYTDMSDILKFISISDIIISAVPSGNFVIPTDMIKKDSIIFDISFEGNFDYNSIFEKVYKIAPRWDLANKGNRINDMTLHRLISNLFYLINNKLPNEALIELKEFERKIIPESSNTEL
jgi:5,10-methylene-tetrahydrofolate dehydrogenase/methenyl tetrahydrofolate cyclohydrolase